MARSDQRLGTTSLQATDADAERTFAKFAEVWILVRFKDLESLGVALVDQ